MADSVEIKFHIIGGNLNGYITSPNQKEDVTVIVQRCEAPATIKVEVGDTVCIVLDVKPPIGPTAVAEIADGPSPPHLPHAIQLPAEAYGEEDPTVVDHVDPAAVADYVDPIFLPPVAVPAKEGRMGVLASANDSAEVAFHRTEEIFKKAGGAEGPIGGAKEDVKAVEGSSKLIGGYDNGSISEGGAVEGLTGGGAEEGVKAVEGLTGAVKGLTGGGAEEDVKVP